MAARADAGAVARVVGAVLAVGLAVGLASGCAGPAGTPRASGPASPPATVAAGHGGGVPAAVRSAVTVLLDARLAALRERDRGGFAATVADPASAGGRHQLDAFDAMVMLPLTGLRYDDVEVRAQPAAASQGSAPQPSWTVEATLGYLLSGFDTAADRVGTTLTVAQGASGWRVVDAEDGSVQPWDLPGMRARRGRASLVIGNVPEATLAAYAALADDAVRSVHAAWPRPWAARVVVVAPGSVEQFARLAGVVDAAQVAAVTDGPLDARGLATGDRVVVNPEVFEGLTAQGRAVVLTHEGAHVAVRASLPQGRAPMWLVEGFAEYVGYLVSTLPRTRLAAELLTSVRDGTGPNRLPGAGDMDPAGSTIAPAYLQAWLAVAVLADRYGRPALLRFYADAAADGTGAAFAVLGTTEADFTRAWLDELDRLSRSAA